MGAGVRRKKSKNESDLIHFVVDAHPFSIMSNQIFAGQFDLGCALKEIDIQNANSRNLKQVS